ncbi:octanoyltransferase [Desulfuromonas versatilis]|uniref:Octanoyltransferase n=1 Tax=Desulfuromonas versatilis TaxID=2802975 RepID=A0ABM8HU31_9BACT|nr:lipoyl(octanoyl) transferase LipB [Desulfuromonas versatilis]BCR06442.1 octanoyltransferase [Desulfuromonas versatilis]
MGSFRTLRPGRLPYREALRLQERLLERNRPGFGDVLVLLEHPPVITLGRSSRPEHLLLSPAELERRGIVCEAVARGGDVTYHGPGQLVGYPIIDLERRGRDLHRYLRTLEEVLIDTLAGFGLSGERIAGKTGVWVGGEKIASIGVGVRRWVTFHGFALNVAADLAGFEAIVPCGLPGVRMTSMERLLGRPIAMAEVQRQVIASFARSFAIRNAGDYEEPITPQTGLA